MEKTMTQTDTQVKEKNKTKAQTETQTESRAEAQENEYVWKMVIPQRRKYCASPAVWAFFGFLIIFANSVELN